MLIASRMNVTVFFPDSFVPKTGLSFMLQRVG